MTPKEIENAIKDGMTTAHVNDDARRMTLILRPRNSSRTFQLVAIIDSIEEI